MKINKKFDFIAKDAEELFQEEMNEVIGGTTSALQTRGCGVCCQYLGGGGSASEDKYQ